MPEFVLCQPGNHCPIAYTCRRYVGNWNVKEKSPNQQVTDFYEEWARECPDEDSMTPRPDWHSDCPYYVRINVRDNDPYDDRGELHK